MNESARRIEFMDYARGIAILSVCLFHSLGAAYGFGPQWQRLFRSFSVPASYWAFLPMHIGGIGVPIFFVVSGFCIHLSFQQHGGDWSGFFIRRFFRLYPAYLAALLFSLFLNLEHDRSWLQFKEHALLIQNFNSQTNFGINPSFWSIAVEVQLYLLYPLLLALVARYGWKSTLIFLAATECLIRTWQAAYQTVLGLSGYDYPVLFHKLLPYYNYVDTPLTAFLEASPLAYWFSWSLGAVIADAVLKNQRMPFARWPAWPWALLVAASYFVRPLDAFFFTFSSLLAATVICKCLDKTTQEVRPPNALLERLRRVGIFSYSLYLFHQPLFDIFCRILKQFFPEFGSLFKYLFCLVFLILLIPLAGFWYRFIELPGIELGKRMLQKRDILMAPGNKALVR